MTLETGQNRCRSAFTFSRSAALAFVVTLMTRRIFGKGTSISSASCVPAAIEGGFRVDGHGLEFDSMFTCALVADDVGAGDQCCDHCLGRRRALIRAIALFGLVDDRSDIAYGNFRARMGRTIAMNTLGDGGLLFHDNHVASRSLLQDSWRSTCRPPVIKASSPDPAAECCATDASHRLSRRPMLASGTAPRSRPRSAMWRSTDDSRPWPAHMDRTAAASSRLRSRCEPAAKGHS